MKTYGFEVCRNALETTNISGELRQSAEASPMPDFMAAGVSDVDFEALSGHGVTSVLLDLDLTLRRAWAKEIEPEIVEHLNESRKNGNIGFIAIATDSGDDIKPFARQIDADAVHQPYKDSGQKINKGIDAFWQTVIEANGINPEETVNIGDRYKKDVRVPGLNGLRTIMVEPLGKDYWFDRLGPIRNVRKKDRLQFEQARAVWSQVLASTGIDPLK